MPATSACLQLAVSISLSALLSMAVSGCGAPSAERPVVLTRPTAVVHAGPAHTAISAPNGPDQLRVVSRLVRTFIRRINHKHAAQLGRLYIFRLIPHIDSARTADVYLALERGHDPSTPLLFREVELRLESGRWVITAALPT